MSFGSNVTPKRFGQGATIMRYCHLHGTQPGACPHCAKARDKRRGTSTQRGYGSEWQRLTRIAKQMYPWCRVCGSKQDLTVDHIDPLTKGQTLGLRDVQVLCRGCNSSKGRRREHLRRLTELSQDAGAYH